MTFLARLFGAPRDRTTVRPLYDAAVALARDPAWYREGAVPDTIDGRFDMMTAVLALVLLRLEAERGGVRRESVLLAETFVDDMDGTLRQAGIGDVVVGKRIGKMMGALGGRVGAFRRGLAGEEDFEAAVRRNVFRGAPDSEAAVAFVGARLRGLHGRLAETPLEQVLAGALPAS